VRDDYNLISEDFSRTRQNPWPETKFLFDNIKRGNKILDLGCGNGRFYQFLKDKDIDYIGIDSSLRLIEKAKERYPDVDFRAADALNLPFSDNSFDKVFSIAVLHHIPSKEFRLKFLREAKRVLKNKGTLILTVWKLRRKEEWLLFFKYTFLKLIDKSKLDFKDILKPWGNKTLRYYHWFSERELIKLVKKEGFKIKEVGIVKNKKGNRQNIYLIASL